MHPSKTQPCVVCAELEEWWLFEWRGYLYSKTHCSDSVIERCRKWFLKASNALHKHKEVCRVSAVWIGGRGERDTIN